MHAPLTPIPAAGHPQARLNEFPRRTAVRDGIPNSHTALTSVQPSPAHLWIPADFQALQPELLIDRKSLRGIAFENSSRLERLSVRCFAGSGLISISIPSSVKVIGEKSFHQCRSLTSVTIEAASVLDRIEQSAFESTALRSIVVPRTVLFLGTCCFASAHALRSLVFERGSILKEMSEQAFLGTGVAELTVPSSVEVIGAYCFYGCGLLEWVGFESGSQLRRIEAGAFADTRLTEVEIPSSVRSISGRAFDRELLESISIHSCPTNFRIRDGMLEEACGRMLVAYFGSAVSIVIGRSVEMIGDGCFYCHDTLMSVLFESDSVLERIETNGHSGIRSSDRRSSLL
jgi:hypothetical protein